MVKVKEIQVPKGAGGVRGKVRKAKKSNKLKKLKKLKLNNAEASGVVEFLKNDHDISTVGVKKIKKKKKPVKEDIGVTEVQEVPPLVRFSDDPIPRKTKWINKQRVLVFGCRGISVRDRHLMTDMRTLLPHSKPESKMERRENLRVVNEICEMKNCNKCMLFEGRLKRDVYMWLANVPSGPSIKFLLENVHTMAELKFTGNCLIGSRPLLSFDESFKAHPHYQVMKEIFIQVFGTPHHHPKSQPFIDHVMTFSVLDNRVWFRNFQILSEDGALVEIGPRFVMNPVKIFDGSFGGETLWENPHYVTPAKYRQLLKKSAGAKYINRVQQKLAYETSRPEQSYKLRETDNIIAENPMEAAKKIVSSNPSQSKVQENYIPLKGNVERKKQKKLKQMKAKVNKNKGKRKRHAKNKRS